MTAPTMTNDVEAVQNYASQLTADSDAWREIAASATAISEQLRNDAADWVATWEPEAGYGVAVDQMCARMDELAASAAATEIEKRATGAVAASLDMADTDAQNGQALDNVNAEVVAI